MVLRNFGEPGEVVSGRLPAAMVRSGMKRNLPLHVLAGILIALFGIPLGFGGVAVLAGTLLTVAGMVAAYFAAAGVVLLTGAVFLLLGLLRMYEPNAWDRLIALGVIHMDGPLGLLINDLSPAGQGLLMIVLAGVFAACGLGMLWLGRRLIRGLRLLTELALDWLGKVAQSIRRRLWPAGSRGRTTSIEAKNYA
jgi:hypothetical protein